MKATLAVVFVLILSSSYSQDSFAGKAFKLTTDFDQENCQDLSRCDCCTSDLIFVNSSSFYYMLACEGSSYYYKGMYSATSDSLTLAFDSIVVANEYNWDFEVDDKAEEFELTFERKEIGSSIFTIELCNNKTLIRTITNKTPEFGLENKNWSNSNLIELEQSKPMILLLNN